MTNKEIALEIAKALDAKKGQDIVIVDIAERVWPREWDRGIQL